MVIITYYIKTTTLDFLNKVLICKHKLKQMTLDNIGEFMQEGGETMNFSRKFSVKNV